MKANLRYRRLGWIPDSDQSDDDLRYYVWTEKVCMHLWGPYMVVLLAELTAPRRRHTQRFFT